MSEIAQKPVTDLDLSQLPRWIQSRPASTLAVNQPGTRAAVLVPLVQRPQGVTVLLTQRTDHLDHHPGQVSFPGGRLEDADQGNAVTCALRETIEEIGLHTDRITVIGCLDERATGTGFRVTPILATIQTPFALTLDAFEVAEVFEVPLSFFAAPVNRRRMQHTVDGVEKSWWSFPWQDRNIWGLTAAILVTLTDELASFGIL